MNNCSLLQSLFGFSVFSDMRRVLIYISWKCYDERMHDINHDLQIHCLLMIVYYADTISFSHTRSLILLDPQHGLVISTRSLIKSQNLKRAALITKMLWINDLPHHTRTALKRQWNSTRCSVTGRQTHLQLTRDTASGLTCGQLAIDSSGELEMSQFDWKSLSRTGINLN